MNNNTSNQFHERVVGDTNKVSDFLSKKGFLGKMVNPGRHGKLKWMNPSTLLQKKRNRDTGANWMQKVSVTRGGYDIIAAGPIEAFLITSGANKGEYVVWDGAGRLGLAQLHGIKEVPVWVVEGTQKESSFYFTYKQKYGRRPLTPEIEKAFEYDYKDDDAIEFVADLDKIGVKFDVNSDEVLPEKSTNPSTRVNAVEQAKKITKGNLDPIKQAVEMIKYAYKDTEKYKASPHIRAELLRGMTALLDTYPKAAANGTFQKFKDFLKYRAQMTEQKKLPFKRMGGNQHNNEAGSIAYGFLREFCNSEYFTIHTGQYIRHGVLLKRFDMDAVRD